MIIIDTMEKQEVKERVSQYLKLSGVESAVEFLSFNNVQCGDYTNSEYDFLVERKSWKDYIGSITDGSLLEQMIKMNENFDGPKYLMFEGDWDAMIDSISNTGIKHLCQCFPLRIQHVYGIAFKACYDTSEVANFLILLNQFSKSLTKDAEPWRGTHSVSGFDQRLLPLLSIPRLGKIGAENLLKNYGCVASVVKNCFEHPKDVIKNIDGVGSTGVKKIADVFYSEQKVTAEKKKKIGDVERKKYYSMQNINYEKRKKKNGYK